MRDSIASLFALLVGAVASSAYATRSTATLLRGIKQQVATTFAKEAYARDVLPAGQMLITSVRRSPASTPDSELFEVSLLGTARARKPHKSETHSDSPERKTHKLYAVARVPKNGPGAASLVHLAEGDHRYTIKAPPGPNQLLPWLADALWRQPWIVENHQLFQPWVDRDLRRYFSDEDQPRGNLPDAVKDQIEAVKERLKRSWKYAHVGQIIPLQDDKEPIGYLVQVRGEDGYSSSSRGGALVYLDANGGWVAERRYGR
jgi:hypothetical protein